MDCEFSDAGCDVKVHRKDLSSHMEKNMVTHMSLLARENRKLKLQYKAQEEQNRQLEEKNRQLEEKIEEVKFRLTRVPPVYLKCLDVRISGYLNRSTVMSVGTNCNLNFTTIVLTVYLAVSTLTIRNFHFLVNKWSLCSSLMKNMRSISRWKLCVKWTSINFPVMV